MIRPSVSSAFIAVDLQNDFCPGGALAVPNGDLVIPIVNSITRKFPKAVATQDWHPKGHFSFASTRPGAKEYSTVDAEGISQVLWPDHCVQGSSGAAFYPSLDLVPFRLIIRKGANPKIDSYSTFFENDRKTPTGLHGWLKEVGVKDVWLAGLATDFCVLYSAMDAVFLGYKTYVLTDAVRAVNVPEGSGERALKAMAAAGIILTTSDEIDG